MSDHNRDWRDHNPMVEVPRYVVLMVVGVMLAILVFVALMHP